ncbi:uncharacterized protein LOC143039031 [Oratosquilla oratoria]|uniref:uncharacterized protein LOC143039031 n=1 Tax=Oratosquilla oratoria TaxID=337810 RepID=UPI003F75D65E
MDGFFTQLTSKNIAIQFEMEKEVEGKLPFLDVLVTRNGHSLSTSVYRKSMNTYRLLNYESSHPACHKRSVVKTLWSRAERVCSTDHSLKEERNRLRKVFRANGYPNKMGKRWTAPQRERDRSATPQATTRVTIPYVKGASEITARLLRRHGVNVAHKPCNTLHGAISKVKD